MGAPLAGGTDFTNQIIQNIGEMSSNGVELNLNFIPVQTENTQWSVAFNASYNKSKITALLNNTPFPVGSISGSTGQYIQQEHVGAEPNAFFVYKQLYNQNGNPIEGAYEDLNGDGAINPTDDQYYYHSPYPHWILGFSTQFTYKRWTIGTVLRAEIGNYVYNNLASDLGAAYGMAINSYLQNAFTDILNTNFTYKQQQSDYYVQNASFLKMDNVSLSYNTGYLDKAKKVSMSISANVQNVFTVTKYKGLDPEIWGSQWNGIDNQIYPIPRVYTMGINLNF